MNNYVNKGQLINSTSGKTVEVGIVKGTGKGEGKEYIKLMFSDKPSEKIREGLKLHNFHYFKPDSSWSAYKTDKALAFAYSLIKENNPQEEAEETPKTETPKKPTSGKGSKTKKTDKTDPKMDKLMESMALLSQGMATMIQNQTKTNTTLDAMNETLKKLLEK